MTKRELSPQQTAFYRVIFGTETGAGKWFDICLIVIILTSVLIIMLDSIESYHLRYGLLFLQIEWAFTLLFTVEYLVRLWCSPNRKAYALSAYGVVDLLALLPTYLSLLIPQTAPLLIIRLLRILRLLSLLNEANILAEALHRAARKILVFFLAMIILATIFGCLLYVVEGPEHGFNSIPHSIYWAIVTITTVGYGDVVPMTPLGQSIAAFGMLIGYMVIAILTGIVIFELNTRHTDDEQKAKEEAIRQSRNCTTCATVEHDRSAHYCRQCGSPLPAPGHEPESK